MPHHRARFTARGRMLVVRRVVDHGDAPARQSDRPPPHPALHATHQRQGRRYQQTLQREWAYAMEYASSQARRTSLSHWVNHYNERRSHSALGNRPLITRVREVTGHNI